MGDFEVGYPEESARLVPRKLIRAENFPDLGPSRSPQDLPSELQIHRII